MLVQLILLFEKDRLIVVVVCCCPDLGQCCQWRRHLFYLFYRSPTGSPTNPSSTPAPIATTTPAPVVVTTPTTSSPVTAAPVMAPTTSAPVTSAPMPAPTLNGIESLKLIYAPTNAIIMDLHNGDIVELTTLSLPTDDFNIQAVTVGTANSVRFSNGRTESGAPYAYCGDSGGNYFSCGDIKVGNNYTISATPRVNGVDLPNVYTVTFSIEPGPAVPTAAPTDAPTLYPGSNWIVEDANAPIEARHEACFVTVDNPETGPRAYLVGGRGDKRTDVYDFQTKTWMVKAKPPQLLHHMQCVAAQGKLYVLGAWTKWYPNEENADQWVYDPATDAWTQLAPMISGRKRGAAAVIVNEDQTKIYVSHGNTGGHETGAGNATSLGLLDEYDIASNNWTAISDNAPNPRDHVGGGLVNGRICVAAGRNGGEVDWPTIGPTDCYDLTTGVWTEEAPVPQQRGGSAYGMTCDGRLIVAGGEGGGRAWDNVEVFNGTSWTSFPSLNVGRHGTGLAVDCTGNPNIIHIASGAANQGGGPEIQHHERLYVF